MLAPPVFFFAQQKLSHLVLDQVVEQYREKGTFSKIATEIDIINQFLELDPSCVPRVLEDRNPSAVLLRRNQTIHSQVSSNPPGPTHT